jgi:xanthine dehydrogenase accessory factor
MFDEFFRTAQELLRAGRPFATATIVRAEKPTSARPGDRAIVTLDGSLHGWIGGSCSAPTVIREARRAIANDQSCLIRLTPDPGREPVPPGITEVPMTCFSGGTLDIFIEAHQPRPRLLLVGSLPVAQALAHLAQAMNYEVIAFDPTGSEAMDHADQVRRDLAELPGLVTPLSFVVVATHGEFDEDGLLRALDGEAPYVGLVASRKRGAAVLQSLADGGASPDALARVRFPAGLDILARRGDEIALSIMAEIVQTRRSAERLAWKDEAPVEPGRTSAPAPETAIDPVCGMTVAVAGAKHTSEHEGRTYYFCCGGCRTRFSRDPAQFLTPRS